MKIGGVKVRRSRTVLIIMAFIALAVILVIFFNPYEKIKDLICKDKDFSLHIIDTSSEILSDDGLRDTVLYYKDANGMLVPIMKKIPWTEGRGIAKSALQSMIDNEKNRTEIEKAGLVPIIPANTEIRGMTIRDGLCKVDFNQAFTNTEGKIEEESLVTGVVYTLTEFPNVSQVQILIDGKAVDQLPYGTNIANVLQRGGINYIGAAKPASDAVLVYYENSDDLNPMFVPVTQAIDTSSGNPDMLDILDKFVSGPPQESGLQNMMPKDTKVVGLEISDSIANIHLSKEILELKDDTLIEKAAKMMMLTIREYYDDVTGVKLLVNDKPIKTKDGEDVFTFDGYANEYDD